MNPLRVLYVNPVRFDYLHAHLIEGLESCREVDLTCTSVANYGGLARRTLDSTSALNEVADNVYDALIVGTEGKYSSLDGLAVAVIQKSRSTRTRLVVVDSGDLGSLPPLPIAWSRVDVLVKRELFMRHAGLSTLVLNLAGRRTRRSIEYQFRSDPVIRFPNTMSNQMARPSLLKFNRRRTALFRGPKLTYCEPIGVEDRIAQPFNQGPSRRVTCTLTGNIDARRELLAHVRQDSRVDTTLIPPADTDADILVSAGAVAVERRTDHVHNTRYLRHLRDHVASINFPGAGFDTARCWEILGAGSLLISKRISLQLPETLDDGTHYVGFDTLRELDDAIQFAVSGSPEVDRIRRAGWDLATTAYSSLSAARRLVQAIRASW